MSAARGDALDALHRAQSQLQQAERSLRAALASVGYAESMKAASAVDFSHSVRALSIALTHVETAELWTVKAAPESE